MTSYYIIFRVISTIEGTYDHQRWMVSSRYHPHITVEYSYDEAVDHVRKFDSPKLQYKILVEETNKNMRGGEYYVMGHENGINPFLCYTSNRPGPIITSYEEATMIIERRVRYTGHNPRNQYLILKEIKHDKLLHHL